MCIRDSISIAQTAVADAANSLRNIVNINAAAIAAFFVCNFCIKDYRSSNLANCRRKVGFRLFPVMLASAGTEITVVCIAAENAYSSLSAI